ncbi:MAG: hypothetical protein LBS31_08970, partial [Candidatus Adiutrix sp.]|nr:hypothetical protein [Candidatus Adiutrix sp.]
HSREIADNLGLGKYLPAFMFFWGLFGLASFGFPGTNGFVGEFLVIAAAFGDITTICGFNAPLVGLLIVPGAMLAAAYMLRVTLKMAWGRPSSAQGRGWPDLKAREWAYMALPAVFVFYLGLAPSGLLSVVDPSIKATVEAFEQRKDLFPLTPPPSLAGPAAPGLSGAAGAISPGRLEANREAGASRPSEKTRPPLMPLDDQQEPLS